ncbi:glycoside hydrolase family 92 protein [Oleiagrimonas sp. C23AA]|nr:GH92 family glycosyl hydrolase [Oleiagrimonas sp. C23AA]NII09647.1 glycoside hydrolase family 92 protein [Oleiagrimonas sp. C23AA]
MAFSIGQAYAGREGNVTKPLSFETAPGVSTQCHTQGWSASVTSGPDKSELLTAEAQVGWHGTHVLEYRHDANAAGTFRCPLPMAAQVVRKGDQLSFQVYPVFIAKAFPQPAEAVAVDISFADGSHLIGQGTVEQRDLPYSAQADRDNRTLYPNQWNRLVVKLDDFAGKQIKSVELVSQAKADAPTFHGYLDSVRIGPAPKVTATTPADFVDTRRGTNANYNFSRGNNFPAVAVPHGFNFWTPTTQAGSDWIYQYQQSNDAQNHPRIQAFALSHEPSPWMGDRQTFQIMPAQVDGTPPLSRKSRALAFTHAHETAKPFVYKVRFDDGIDAAMTPTDHAAMMSFTFPKGHGQLIFDNKNDKGGLTLDPTHRSISGYSDVKSGLSTGATRLFFYATFDKPVSAHGRYEDSKRKDVSGWYAFDAGKVNVRIATSLISVAQAKHNMALEMAPGDTFASIESRARAAWNKRFEHVTIPGAGARDKETLYSNMYRVFLYPNQAFENVGSKAHPQMRYASPFSKATGTDTPTHTGARVLAGKPYVNNGFWDTYRTAWPLYALLTPHEDGQMIDGFVQQYRDGGWIARWSSPGYADLMVGTSADVAFTDAWVKGVHNFDVKSFYQAALKDATVVSPIPGAGRKDTEHSIFRGYTSTATNEGMSWSMAGYLNDFGIAQLAATLAKHPPKGDAYANHYADDAEYFRNRALDYVNLFDPKVRFFMGRKSDGDWRATPKTFDPYAWGGDYTETNAWVMSVDAVQDGQGLANLYGGRKALAAHLDKLFNAPNMYHTGHYHGVIHEMREARQVRMGQYQHSNQPSHHIIYMYDVAGQPWKTQDKVRDVLTRLYTGNANGQGYPGDEDNGEMSAWYVFSAAGFYPLRVGTAEYAIGAPYYPHMVIHLENGHRIDIRAPGVSNTNRYIQSVTLNGKPYNSPWISHADLIAGAKLVFKMGPNPSKWGAGVTPPSITKGHAKPDPMVDLADAVHGTTRVAGKADTAVADNNSDTAATIAAGASVSVHFAAPQRVAMYTLTSASIKGGDAARWRLQGSSDGKHWTTLDQRQGQAFDWRQQTRAYTVAHPGRYTDYRWVPAGHTPVKLAEIEWLGHPATH